MENNPDIAIAQEQSLSIQILHMDCVLQVSLRVFRKWLE